MAQISTALLPALATLAAVVALILLAGRAARLTGFARSAALRGYAGRPQRLLLQDSLAIDRARRVHLLRCDGRDILLLTGGTTDVVIGWVPAQPDGAA